MSPTQNKIALPLEGAIPVARAKLSLLDVMNIIRQDYERAYVIYYIEEH